MQPVKESFCTDNKISRYALLFSCIAIAGKPDYISFAVAWTYSSDEYMWKGFSQNVC